MDEYKKSYKGYIYWYNGTSYEEAKVAGPERRKQFACKIMKRFGYCTLAFFFYSIFSIMIGILYGIDITVALVGIVGTAISTMKIKL